MDELNEVGAWGKLNAVVYLERPWVQFYGMAEGVASQFNASEVIFDSFDLDSKIPGEGRLDRWGDHVIRRAILEKGAEKIIVDQQGELCCVKHLFRPDFLLSETGAAIIRELLCNNPDSAVVLGFELSIWADSVQQVLDIVRGDRSQNPLIVIEPGKEPVEYGSMPETERVLSVLRGYWRRIN